VELDELVLLSLVLSAQTLQFGVLLLLSLFVGHTSAGGADASKPHPHQGVLAKYARQPPSKIGISMAGVTDEELRRGEPTLRLMNAPGGFTRAVSVQDVHAPESVVWDAIMGLNDYPKLVEGVTECKVYSDHKNRVSGERVVCATYRISAAGYGIRYFMKHIYEPSKHCMTFHLDYDRCSELSDTVGYWYVEALKDGWCRVYYSTDSQLPRFIPGFAKDMLTKLASKRSTGWVEKRCNEVTGFSPTDRPASSRLKRPLSLPSPKQVALLLTLLFASQRAGGQQAVMDLLAKLGKMAPW